jgi:hypothetical protein
VTCWSPTRDRSATPFQAARSRLRSPASLAHHELLGESCVVSFVSCRHTTSGSRWSNHGRRRGSHCFTGFTFQVAMRI